MNINTISDLANWMMTLLNFGSKKGPETNSNAGKDKLPIFLDLSLEDERRWAKLWMQLTKKERRLITKLMNMLEPYQQKRFRQVIAGIASGEDVPTKAVSGTDEKTIMIAGEDSALEFLRDVTKFLDEEGEAGFQEAIEQYKLGGIIENSFFRQFLKEGNELLKSKALPRLGISSWKELADLEKLQEIDGRLAAKIRAARLAKKNRTR